MTNFDNVILDPQQTAAVQSENRSTLVLAGAGTGKTTVLCYRVQALLDRGIPPERILLITFSSEAASSLIQRTAKMTSLPEALFRGGTFHHLGRKILLESVPRFGLGKDFQILEARASKKLMASVLASRAKQFPKDLRLPQAGEILAQWNLCRIQQESLDIAFASLLADRPHRQEILNALDLIISDYETTKAKDNWVDFDDLILKPVQLFRSCPELKERWQECFDHILVDEYQDTNAAQRELLQCLTERCQISAVGDEGQSIYSWRGADPGVMEEFCGVFEGTGVYKVESNFRSNPEILTLANAIPLGRKETLVLKSTRDPGHKPQRASFPHPREEAAWIVQTIRKLKDQGHGFRGMAILYRVQAASLQIQLALSQHQIPFRLCSEAKPFFQRKAILSGLTLIQWQLDQENPCKQDQLRDALLRGQDEGTWSQWKYRFQFIPRADPSALTANLACLPGKDLILFDPERSPDSIREDFQSLRLFFENGRDQPEELLRKIEGQNLEEAGEEAVWMGSVHQAKGLEFPVVFLPGMSEGLFPLRRVVEKGDIDEERRLFYVAVTRTQERLFLSHVDQFTHSNGKERALAPSPFLEELENSPDDLSEVLEVHLEESKL